MNLKKTFHTVMKYRATPYLAICIIIAVLILISCYTPFFEWSNNLLVEMIGALLLLGSFDALQTWKTNRAQKQEAQYRLYLEYQLIYSHAKKYLAFFNEMTCDNLLNKENRDLSKIKFTDLEYFFNQSLYSDIPSESLAYHFYFESLFNIIKEVRQATHSLSPVHHFEIVEVYREFIEKNEPAYRLYNYFKSVEGNSDKKGKFFQELEKYQKGIIKSDVHHLAKNVSPLNQFAKIHLLTLTNLDLLVKQAALVEHELKDFYNKDRTKLNFDFNI